MKKPITIQDFCDQHAACDAGRTWALSQGVTTMRDLWRLDIQIAWRQWIFMRVARGAARGKYDKAKEAAWAKFGKAKEAARAKYDKATGAAWAKYTKARGAAWAKFDKARGAAWAKYTKASDAARVEYNKASDAAILTIMPEFPL